MTGTSKQESWRATLIPADATIQAAIHSLQASGMQIALAISESQRLVGTITDGDIRRAMLNGLTLANSIADFVNRNPLVVPPGIDRKLALQLMRANKIRQLPVVDCSGEIVDLHVWETMVAPAALENIMVIMAGGRGTRLGHHTKNCPKPMLEVAGKPMLERIIERATADGFSHFTISVNYLGSIIEDYFEDGSKWGCHIEYLREESPLGTAGSLSLMRETPTAPFIVTNGDVLTDLHYNDILDFHVRHNAFATMAVRQYELQNQFGVVKTSGIEIEGFEEKPIYRSHINAGIYVLEPESINQLEPQQHCDMPTLFGRIKERVGPTIVYPMHEPWLDVGRPDDLANARRLP